MKILLILAIPLLLAFCPPVFAGSLTVVTEEFPPLNFLDDKGRLTGVSTAIVERTLAEAGLTPDFMVLPWARAYNTALNEPNVLIFTILRTPNREDDFHWIGPILPNMSTHFYRLSGRRDIELTSLDGVRLLTTAVTRDDIVHHYLKAQGLRDGIELDVASSELQSLKKLFAGRVDLVCTNTASMGYWLRAIGRSQNEVVRLIPLAEFSYYMAFGKMSDPALVKRVHDAFRRIQEPPQ